MPNAYNLVPLVSDDKKKITSATFYQDYLLVGTKNGHLMMFRLLPNASKGRPRLVANLTQGSARLFTEFDVRFVRVNKTFATAAVEQLSAVTQYQIVISLAGGLISVHKIGSVHTPLVCTVQCTKGASYFTHSFDTDPDAEDSVLRLSVIIDRRLVVLTWMNNSFAESTLDLKFPHAPKTVAAFCGSVFVGFKDKYMLLTAEGMCKNLLDVGESGQPNAIIIRNGRETNVGLTVDCNTFIFNKEGIPISKILKKWTQPPLMMASDPPFVIAVVPSNTIEIRRVCPNAELSDSFLCDSVSKVAVADGRYSNVLLMSPDRIFTLLRGKTDLHMGSPETEVASTRPEESSAQCVPRTPKVKLASLVFQAQAVNSLSTGSYRKALELFQKCGTDPASVVSLFPDLALESFQKDIILPCPPLNLNEDQREEASEPLLMYLLKWFHQVVVQSGVILTKIHDINIEKELNYIYDCVKKCCQVVGEQRLKVISSAATPLVAFRSLIPLYKKEGLLQEASEVLCLQANLGNFRNKQELNLYVEALCDLSLDTLFAQLPFLEAQGFEILLHILGSEEYYSRKHIVNYIEQHNPDMIIPFLEHIIWRCEDTTREFHDALISEYATAISDTSQKTLLEERSEKVRFLKLKLRNFLASSRYYSVTTVQELLTQSNLKEEVGAALAKREDLARRSK